MSDVWQRVIELEDEIARLRDENARHVDFRMSINKALPRPFGVTVLGAIAELRTENALLQAENERLRAENTRLREAMPSEEERFALGMTLHSGRPQYGTVFPWLQRLDAARKGGG